MNCALSICSDRGVTGAASAAAEFRGLVRARERQAAASYLQDAFRSTDPAERDALRRSAAELILPRPRAVVVSD